MEAGQWLRRGRARLAGLPTLAVDTALACLLAAVSISSQWLIEPDMVFLDGWDGPGAASVAVALAATLPLALRRRYPEAVLAAVGVASLVGVPLGVPEHGFGLFLGLYSVAAYARPASSYTALGIFAVANLAALLMAEAVQFLALQLVIFLTAWALGHQAQARRRDAEELASRAAQLEWEREDRARRAVIDERGRIARELHDIIAHSVSVMVVQATAAGRLVRPDPDRAERAIAEVVRTGRGSLRDMRRLVSLLKEGDGPLGPLPGVGSLPELVADFRDAGLPVTLRVEGEARELPPSADLSAFRIVQEALTNTLKHADAESAVVRLAYRDTALEVEVIDDGHGGEVAADADADGGHGIPGMRERVALVGGELACGPLEGSGYRVRALLPAEDSA